MRNYEDGSGFGIWGIAIFLLILFAAWGGWGNNRNAYGSTASTGCGCGFSNCNTDRDVLKLETAMVSANALSTAQLETGLRAVIDAQERNTSAILNGQKDMYIKQLEQQATQMFITGQNEATRNLINMRTAEAEAQTARESCQLNYRLDRIEAEMLKRPPFAPFGGLPLVGCNNLPASGCGCGSFSA